MANRIRIGTSSGSSLAGSTDCSAASVQGPLASRVECTPSYFRTIRAVFAEQQQQQHLLLAAVLQLSSVTAFATMAALSADALALLRQVQQILTPPKFAPGALEMFFVVNCINDKEELAAMLDEPALMECGIARAPSRVAISRITAEILETSGESTQATDEETCCVDAQQAADQAAEFVRLAEAEARSQPRASAAMSDIETMLATRGTAAGSDAIRKMQKFNQIHIHDSIHINDSILSGVSVPHTQGGVTVAQPPVD